MATRTTKQAQAQAQVHAAESSALPITLAFSRPRRWTLMSWLIKVFTKSKVSHCLIGTQVHGVPMFLQCTAGGVQLTPRERYERDDEVVYEWRFVPDMSVGIAHAVKHVQDAYDYPALLGFAWAIVLRNWFKIRVRNPFARAQAYVCSEFVLHIDHASTIPEFRGLDPETTHCQTLVDRIKAGGGSFVQIKGD